MRTMWFGTQDYMQWVRTPDVSMPSSKAGWSTQAAYLNGGAYVRRSTAAHKEFALTWSGVRRDDVRPILDYADRLYGDGPIFWSDPFTMEYNVLPQWFASPSQGLVDGIPLNSGVRGTAVATSANNFGYPTQSIRYVLPAAGVGVRVWIPIPPGHTLWVGVHGEGTGSSGVVVIPTTGPGTTGPAVAVPMTAVTSAERVTTPVPGDVNTGAYVTLEGTGVAVLSGIIAQVWPTGAVPPTGGFISGQGHSGCQFTEQPSYTPYSAAMDRVGMSAALTETGGWADSN